MDSAAPDARPTPPAAGLRRQVARAGTPERATGPGSRLMRAAEALLVAAVVLAPWAYGGAPDEARYALAAVLLAALALWAAALGRRGARLPPFAARAVGLPALAVVQAGVGLSADPLASLDAALLLTAGLGVAAFWSERARARHGSARRLAAAVLAVAAAQGVFGAVQQALGPGRIYGQATPLVTSPFGSYVNHNHFAGLAAMAVVLAVGLAWGQARRAAAPTPAAIGLGGLALGLAATLLASRSRGGLVALGCGLAALILLRVRAARPRTDRGSARRLAVGASLTLVVGIGAALALVPEATRAHLLGTFTGAAATDTSSRYRADTALATLRLAAHHPLMGAGFGAFPDAVAAHKTTHGELRTTHAESDVLELLAEGGLAGLLLCGALAAFTWRRLRERLEHGRDAARIGLAEGAAAALVALGVHSLFDFNLRLPANALVAASLLGLVAAGRARPAHGGERAEGERRAPAAGAGTGRTLPLAWLAAAALALLATVASWRAHGAWQLARALALPAPQRLGALDGVTRAHPWLAEAWHARGLAWRALVRPGTATDARLARAHRDLAEAVRLRPGWGQAWADLGWLQFMRGDVPAARADLDRAVGLDPTHIGIGVTRAALCARTGDLPEGLRQLARTLDANPGWGAAAALGVARTWTSSPDALAALIGDDPQWRRLLEQALANRTPASK